MNSFKVALLQISPENSLEANLEKGLNACRRAKEMGADLALFPEMWSIGYRIPQDAETLNRNAVAADSAFVQSFGSLAKALNMAIAVSFLESYTPAPRNTVCLFDRFGSKVLTYAKVHTCDFGFEGVLTAGDEFPVCDLNTENGTVKVGAMICFDREFPESARILMLNGAEIVLVPNACPMEINRLSQLRARAYENMVGIATANYPSGRDIGNGHSTAFDGAAYDLQSGESRDMLFLETDEAEGIYLADFPMEKLRAFRAAEVQGNAYRHPQKYHKLTDERIAEPFIRPDYRK